MKKLRPLIIVLFSIVFFYSCNNEKEPTTISKDLVSGVIQKGPFINGSSITLFELSEAFAPSGSSYNTQIVDDRGTFEFRNILLESNYVKLRADGYYFNEVTGQKSVSQITLYAFTDLSDKSLVNVNILSHLEYQRVENLVSKGSTFNLNNSQTLIEFKSSMIFKFWEFVFFLFVG